MSPVRQPTEEELYEAESRRFGGGTLMLQPLEGGAWALRSNSWDLLGMFDPEELSMADFAEVVREFAARGRGVYARQAAVEAERRRGAVKEQAPGSVEDAGL